MARSIHRFTNFICCYGWTITLTSHLTFRTNVLKFFQSDGLISKPETGQLHSWSYNSNCKSYSRTNPKKSLVYSTTLLSRLRLDYLSTSINKALVCSGLVVFIRRCYEK